MTTYWNHMGAAARLYRRHQLRDEMSYRRSLIWLGERADLTWSERNCYDRWIRA